MQSWKSSRLSPQWLCGNSCTWAHVVDHLWPLIYINMYIYVYILQSKYIQIYSTLYIPPSPAYIGNISLGCRGYIWERERGLCKYKFGGMKKWVVKEATRSVLWKRCSKFTGKHMRQSPFFNKNKSLFFISTLLKKGLFAKFCKI